MWRCSTQHSGSRCTCSIESHFWCVWGWGGGVYVWSMWECVGDNNAANYGWRTICSGFHLGTPLVPVIPILIVVCIETFENLQQSRQNSNCYCPVFGRLMMIKMKMKWWLKMKMATVKMKTVTVEMNVGWHEWSDPNDGPRPPAAQKHTTKNTQYYNWLQPPRIHKTTIT